VWSIGRGEHLISKICRKQSEACHQSIVNCEGGGKYRKCMKAYFQMTSVESFNSIGTAKPEGRAEAVASSGVPLTSSFLIMSSPGGRKHYQAKTILHSSAKHFCRFPLVSGFPETWKGNLYKNHTIFLRFCSP